MSSPPSFFRATPQRPAPLPASLPGAAGTLCSPCRVLPRESSAPLRAAIKAAPSLVPFPPASCFRSFRSAAQPSRSGFCALWEPRRGRCAWDGSGPAVPGHSLPPFLPGETAETWAAQSTESRGRGDGAPGGGPALPAPERAADRDGGSAPAWLRAHVRNGEPMGSGKGRGRGRR